MRQCLLNKNLLNQNFCCNSPELFVACDRPLTLWILHNNDNDKGKGKETLFIHGIQFKAVSLWGRVGEMLVFGEGGKPEYFSEQEREPTNSAHMTPRERGEGNTGVPGENLSEQEREPTNSAHMRRRIGESNPGHIGGRRVLSPLRYPCSPMMIMIMIMIMMITMTVMMIKIAVNGEIYSMIWFLIDKKLGLTSQGLPLKRIKYYIIVVTSETRYRYIGSHRLI